MRFEINPLMYIDVSEPLDISIELTHKPNNPRAWYVDLPKFEPVRANGFIGSIEEGGSVNFRNIMFNPHGHGTHTECFGHISREWVNVNETLKTFWFKIKLVSLEPQATYNEQYNENDLVLTLDQFRNMNLSGVQGLVVRTLPNGLNKKSKNYSATNPPYFEPELADWLVENDIKHFLVDLPSVDREVDGGKLDFHHRFWRYPKNPRKEATITELIFVPDSVQDGLYMMNLQMAAFNNDAAPSRPVLYKIHEKTTGQSHWTESHLDQV